MSENNQTPTLTKKDFTSDQDVRWCPGCGDYAILSQVQKIFPTFGIPKENFLIVSGIFFAFTILACHFVIGFIISI